MDVNDCDCDIGVICECDNFLSLAIANLKVQVNIITMLL